MTQLGWIPLLRLALIGAVVAISLSACVQQGDRRESHGDLVTLSIVGTNDIHGQFMPYEDRGGITTLSGYIEALRKARSDDGAVLLIDGGDMWQGSLESNLNEGAIMVEAFNALGYAASTIGNHEFDFGPIGANAIPVAPSDDPREVLKQRAREANFPLLAANLIDTATGERVTWDNVIPTTIVEVAGIRIGIIGVLTRSTPYTTIPANVVGLRIAPLTETIVREATALRKAGADIVVVTAHAGGRCDDFSDPLDTSSCDLSREILAVANSLPRGLVDYINGGHEAHAIAHIVNGIAVTTGLAYTRTMSRVDLVIDRSSVSVRDVRVYPPQRLCQWQDPTTGDCAWPEAAADDVAPATYEGHPLTPDPAVVALAKRATAAAAELKNEQLGMVLADRFTREGSPNSALANLTLRALYESLDADVAILNVSGGLRADLPAGELQYGDVYAMFPFDNRVAMLDITGAELRKIVARQAHNHRRRAGIHGVRVEVGCADDRLEITMTLNDGRVVRDEDRILLAANDFLALGGDGVLVPIMPADGLEYADDPRFVREVVADWLRNRGGTITPADFANEASRRWFLPANLPATCALY